jgi:hypothetical protein
MAETLSFVEHTQSVSSKVARNVGMMRKLKHFFPVKILRSYLFFVCAPLFNLLLFSVVVHIHCTS